MNVLSSHGLKVRLPNICKMSFFILVVLGLLSGQAFAFSCNSQLEMETDGTEFNEKDLVTIQVKLGAGKISGGQENTITIDAFHFGTDCANDDAFPLCTGQGNTISYVPDSTVTTCLDSKSKLIEFDVQGGQMLDFVPNNDTGPIFQKAGTFCLITFKLMIDEFVSPPGDSSFVFEAGGWQRSEGNCDNGFNSDGTASVAFTVNKTAISTGESSN